MRKEKIMELINAGENITVEFKQSKNKLNRDVYDSVCSFLNRFGGHLFLGVKDDRTIVGVDEDSVQQIKKDFVTALNNGNKINLDRYDDRDDIRVNFIRSYERLMQFVEKYLNDKFYLEGDQRVSLRDKIFLRTLKTLK